MVAILFLFLFLVLAILNRVVMGGFPDDVLFKQRPAGGEE